MRTVALLTLLFSLPVVAAENDWLLGSWKITEARFPGITAMTEQEADEWVDHTIHYNEDSASINGQVCTNPTYTINTISAHDFASMYRVSFEMLGINDAEVDVADMTCPSGWEGPGTSLIKKDEISGFTVWDGVYFQVKRQGQ